MKTIIKTYLDENYSKEEQFYKSVELKDCEMCGVEYAGDDDLCPDCTDDYDRCECGEWKQRSERTCEYCENL